MNHMNLLMAVIGFINSSLRARGRVLNNLAFIMGTDVQLFATGEAAETSLDLNLIVYLAGGVSFEADITIGHTRVGERIFLEAYLARGFHGDGVVIN